MERKEEERKRLNEEAEQEESKSGKREAEGEKGKGLRSKEGVLIVCPAKFSRTSVPYRR